MRIRVLTTWTALSLCVLGVAQDAAKPALHADRVLVLKNERTLQLLSQGKVIHSYRVALGGDPVGPKTRQGDHKTPEGLYVLDSRNSHSQFYKSIHISYPSARDRTAARQSGVLPGGDVFVHACRMAIAGWDLHPGGRTGPTAASQSRTPRWTRSGRRSPMAQ